MLMMMIIMVMMILCSFIYLFNHDVLNDDIYLSLAQGGSGSGRSSVRGCSASVRSCKSTGISRTIFTITVTMNMRTELCPTNNCKRNGAGCCTPRSTAPTGTTQRGQSYPQFLSTCPTEVQSHYVFLFHL